MKNSLFAKTFAALILSSFLVLSAGTANAKRLTAAVARKVPQSEWNVPRFKQALGEEWRRAKRQYLGWTLLVKSTIVS